MVEGVDLPAGELGGQALAVPVRQQANDDDCLLYPPGQTTGYRAARPVDECLETSDLAADPPAMQARAAGPEGECRRDALLPGDPDAPRPKPEAVQIRTDRPPRRTTAARSQELEARALLVRVAKKTAMQLGAVLDRELVHRRTLGRAGLPCLTNYGNYT